MTSVSNSCAWFPPIEIVIISTPSAIASSNAERISLDWHEPGPHTLYAEILAEGTPPLAVPCASP
jgi:hypothetical protein